MNAVQQAEQAQREKMLERRDAQLIVVGDSHTRLFNGRNVHNGPDMLAPYIRTNLVGSALAWNLMTESSTTRAREQCLAFLEAARELAYTGWIMFTFGSIDLSCQTIDAAIRLGLANAVKDTADRYLSFLDAARAIYPKIAVWGPPAATPESHMPQFEALFGPNTLCGSEIDRNFATMLFSEYIGRHAEARGIPFLSLFDLMIQEDGRTAPESLCNCVHASSAYVPYILDLLDWKLGVRFELPLELKNYAQQEIASLRNPDPAIVRNDFWLRLPLPNHRYVDAVGITARSLTLIP